jgi:hypothetical protein
MTTLSGSQIDRSQALIDEIRAGCAEEEKHIFAAAKAEAETVVGAAFSAARRRVTAEIEALRHDAERQLVRAKAQIETERRLRDQARAAEILHTGCPMLINATVERWHDPATRRLWIGAFADEALNRLWPGEWTIEHPADWDAADAEVLEQRLHEATRMPALKLVSSDDFEAGLRARSRGAVLDSTPERLLADKAATQARLLAEMHRKPPASMACTRGERT